jgi:hypothetical protein
VGTARAVSVGTGPRRMRAAVVAAGGSAVRRGDAGEPAGMGMAHVNPAATAAAIVASGRERDATKAPVAPPDGASAPATRRAPDAATRNPFLVSSTVTDPSVSVR